MGEWQVCAVCYKTKSVLWRNPWKGCQKSRLGGGCGGNPESWIPGGGGALAWSRVVVFYIRQVIVQRCWRYFLFGAVLCADVAIHDTSSSGENTLIADTCIQRFTQMCLVSPNHHTRDVTPYMTHGASLKVNASLLRIWHKLEAAPNSGWHILKL